MARRKRSLPSSAAVPKTESNGKHGEIRRELALEAHLFSLSMEGTQHSSADLHEECTFSSLFVCHRVSQATSTLACFYSQP
jgi:hypothetical protein